MKKSSAGYFVLWLLLVATVLGISAWNRQTPTVKDKPAAVAVQTPKATPLHNPVSPQREEELVGVWIPYMSLETKEGTEEAFKANFKTMVQQAKDMEVNALFVHVRPFGDALYPSEYFPWSHLITGTQGKDPGFDPLAFMLDTAHENGMELHAWINPLRVKTAKTPELLAENNPYTQLAESKPYYFMQVEGAVHLNPAYSEMRALISNGVREIVENYAVDGIHFDDYFYPEGDDEMDRIAYEGYCESTAEPLALADWRVANINTLISQVYRTVKEIDAEMPFGISPQGNIGNNRALGADVFSWCNTKGYIDYICPQIYFSYDNPALGFTEALEGWLAMTVHEELKVYVGLGLYKAGTDSDSGTWETSSDQIAKQIEETRERGCDGFVLFDIGSFGSEAAMAEVQGAKKVLQ